LNQASHYLLIAVPPRPARWFARLVFSFYYRRIFPFFETSLKVCINLKQDHTQVAGNLPLPLAVKNALLSVGVANPYRPPVFAGMAKPLLRDLFTSEFVHGDDGMGNLSLPEPALAAEREHAVDALIRILTGAPDELELITRWSFAVLPLVTKAYLPLARRCYKIEPIQPGGLP
jgi:hypothetical protein